MRRRAIVVVGLGFGDEGKGTVVDWLTRELGAGLVVRFNGGGQAAHHVVAPDGVEHRFQMFGAGTLAGAHTYLSEHVLINPLVLAVEAGELARLEPGLDRPLTRLSAHRDAALTTPFHVALNRIRELAAGGGRHGSCGLGIGETMRDVLAGDAIRLGELARRDWRRRLADQQERARCDALALLEAAPLDEVTRVHAHEQLRVIADRRELDATIEIFELIAGHISIVDRLPRAEVTVFEGAQGVLLDENWGFAPHHTWSTTTSANARQILGAEPDIDTNVLGVLRAFSTRHGRGPLMTELTDPDLREALLEGEHNTANAWQEDFRAGWPDAVATRYAALADGHLDGLVVTCTDRLPAGPVQVAARYDGVALDLCPPTQAANRARTERIRRAVVRYETADAGEVPGLLARACGVPLRALSRGRTAGDKQWVPKNENSELRGALCRSELSWGVGDT